MFGWPTQSIRQFGGKQGEVIMHKNNTSRCTYVCNVVLGNVQTVTLNTGRLWDSRGEISSSTKGTRGKPERGWHFAEDAGGEGELHPPADEESQVKTKSLLHRTEKAFNALYSNMISFQTDPCHLFRRASSLLVGKQHSLLQRPTHTEDTQKGVDNCSNTQRQDRCNGAGQRTSLQSK